jgi:hypothetical protein
LGLRRLWQQGTKSPLLPGKSPTQSLQQSSLPHSSSALLPKTTNNARINVAQAAFIVLVALLGGVVVAALNVVTRSC